MSTGALFLSPDSTPPLTTGLTFSKKLFFFPFHIFSSLKVPFRVQRIPAHFPSAGLHSISVTVSSPLFCQSKATPRQVGVGSFLGVVFFRFEPMHQWE
jgi:hypothetical protein